jgi:hypothetical protein
MQYKVFLQKMQTSRFPNSILFGRNDFANGQLLDKQLTLVPGYEY